MSRKLAISVLKGAYKSYFVLSTGATVVAIAGAWWWRPLPEPTNASNATDTATGTTNRDHSSDSKGTANSIATSGFTMGDGPKRNPGTMSEFAWTDYADRPRPVLLELAVSFTISFTAILSRLFLYYAGHTHVKQDENYENFLKSVTNHAAQNKPLLTVSNHRSLLDDPLILSGVLPMNMMLLPKYNRNAVCTQEYCFNEHLPTLIHAYMGAGQVLPIRRGAGVNQKLLLDFARLLAAGKWCHVMPEGGIWQTAALGSKREPQLQQQIGKLKWGVGKLIAHAPVRPQVIPFFFSGTENIYPQHPETKVVINRLPRTGHRVDIRFGKELFFDDLIEEHERKHGPLWKYRASVEEERQRGLNPENFHAHWDSHPEDYELYSKITLRIQHAIERLNEESNRSSSELH